MGVAVTYEEVAPRGHGVDIDVVGGLELEREVLLQNLRTPNQVLQHRAMPSAHWPEIMLG
jgi:hypothetical protein